MTTGARLRLAISLCALSAGCPKFVSVGEDLDDPADGAAPVDAVDAAVWVPSTPRCVSELAPDPAGARAVELAAGGERSCVRTLRGRVACWGAVQGSQEPAWVTPREVPGVACASALNDARAAGAVLADGSVRLWFGPAATHARGIETAPGVTGLAPMAPPATTGLALTSGRGCAWGDDGAVRCWGGVFRGRLYDETRGTNPRGSTLVVQGPTTLDGFEGVARLQTSTDVGPGHACALRRDGLVACIGQNDQGELGTGPGPSRVVPVNVPGVVDARDLSVGQGTTCVVRGDERVLCWGRGTEGQLGDGGLVNRPSAREVVGISDATQITLGALHACVRTRRGTVLCWGSNGYGQLGGGPSAPRTQAQEVRGLSRVLQVAAGEWHTCALQEDGAVWCWGANAQGQLGDGTQRDRAQPVRVLR